MCQCAYCCVPFQADEISHVIAELEKSIARYKEEYAGLISQAQAIKADLSAVEAKVRLVKAMEHSSGTTSIPVCASSDEYTEYQFSKRTYLLKTE